MRIESILQTANISYEKVQAVLKNKNPYEILFVDLHFNRARLDYLTNKLSWLHTLQPAYEVISCYITECQSKLEILEDLASKIELPQHVDIFIK